MLRYTDKPGDRTKPHHHPDSVLITFSHFRRRLTVGDRPESSCATRVTVTRYAIRGFGYAQSACDADRPFSYYVETFDLGAAFFRVTRAIGTTATAAAIATAQSEPASPGLFDMTYRAAISSHAVMNTE